MTIPPGASIVSLPDTGKPYPTLLGFLAGRFPRISKQTWLERIVSGKVLTEEGQPITLDSPYMPNRRLFYYREVKDEPLVPFDEQIVFKNSHLLVACKPHFLPVSPAGQYLHETLIERLKETTGNPFLSLINRIDRGTAGLVLVSVNKDTRGLYQQLFMNGLVRKTYEAISDFSHGSRVKEWIVENRLEPGHPWFRMQPCSGKVNARSRILMVEAKDARARFQLFPITGKKHQLRIHLSGLGFPIINDRYYPELLPEMADDFSRPLQLLSKKIEFIDPLTNQEMSFTSRRNLTLDCARQ